MHPVPVSLCQSRLGPVPPHMQEALSRFDEERISDEKAALARLFREVKRRVDLGRGHAADADRDDGEDADADESTYKSDSSDEAMFWGFKPWQREHPGGQPSPWRRYVLPVGAECGCSTSTLCRAVERRVWSWALALRAQAKAYLPT